MSAFLPSGRARGVTIVVEGFFAFAWFGWGQAAPPRSLVLPLAIGAGLGAVLVTLGLVTTFRSGGRLLAASDPVVRRRYGITVGVEVGLILAGALTLGLTGESWWLPAWVCGVVGVHFLPMARVLQNPSLRPLGVILAAVAVLALVSGLGALTAPSTVTGSARGWPC